MLKSLFAVFDWKNHPGNVFYVMVPLALTGFGALGLRAYLEFTMHQDPVYGYMLAIGLVVLVIAMLPAYRMHQQIQRLKQLYPKSPDKVGTAR